MRYGHWQSFNILWTPRRVLLRLTPLLPTNGAGLIALVLGQILFQLVVIKGLAHHVLIVGVEGLAVVVVAPGRPGVRVAVKYSAAAVMDFLEGFLLLGRGLGA